MWSISCSVYVSDTAAEFLWGVFVALVFSLSTTSRPINEHRRIDRAVLVHIILFFYPILPTKNI